MRYTPLKAVKKRACVTQAALCTLRAGSIALLAVVSAYALYEVAKARS